MQVEQIKIADLKSYERNSRTHDKKQIDKVAASITEFGFTNPVLIQDDGTIIAGHGRVEAAKKLNMQTVPCLRLSHLTQDQIKAYVIADNALAELAGWDTDMLKAELGDLQAAGYCLDLLGLTNLDSLMSDLTAGSGLTDPDDVPDPPAEPVTRMGDVWMLDKHRLMCGSSTDPTAVRRLLGGGGTSPHGH